MLHGPDRCFTNQRSLETWSLLAWVMAGLRTDPELTCRSAQSAAKAGRPFDPGIWRDDASPHNCVIVSEAWRSFGIVRHSWTGRALWCPCCEYVRLSVLHLASESLLSNELVRRTGS